MNRLRSVLRAPPLHFLVLGALLYFGALLWSDAPEGTGDTPLRVVITAAQVEALVREITVQSGRVPGRAQLDSAVRAIVDDDLLYQRALEMKLDRGHPGIKERLTTLARFITEDADMSDANLYQEALDLGLLKSDLVVRRQLVTQMRLVAQSVPLRSEREGLTERQMQSYLERHPQRFARPGRVSFSHVYFSREKRGAQAYAAAEAALDEFAEAHPSAGNVASKGDAFLHGAKLQGLSHRKIAERFGGPFSRAVRDNATSTWFGPVESHFGWHLVRVDQQRPAEPPQLIRVRGEVRDAIQSEQREVRLRARLANWRANSTVEIDWGAAEHSLRKARN